MYAAAPFLPQEERGTDSIPATMPIIFLMRSIMDGPFPSQPTQTATRRFCYAIAPARGARSSRTTRAVQECTQAIGTLGQGDREACLAAGGMGNGTTFSVLPSALRTELFITLRAFCRRRFCGRRFILPPSLARCNKPFSRWLDGLNTLERRT